MISGLFVTAHGARRLIAGAQKRTRMNETEVVYAANGVVSHPKRIKRVLGWAHRKWWECGCGHPHDSRSGGRRYGFDLPMGIQFDFACAFCDCSKEMVAFG